MKSAGVRGLDLASGPRMDDHMNDQVLSEASTCDDSLSNSSSAVVYRTRLADHNTPPSSPDTSVSGVQWPRKFGWLGHSDENEGVSICGTRSRSPSSPPSRSSSHPSSADLGDAIDPIHTDSNKRHRKVEGGERGNRKQEQQKQRGMPRTENVSSGPPATKRRVKHSKMKHPNSRRKIWRCVIGNMPAL